MAKHTISDLYQMQSLPLYIKIRMTQSRIREWINEYGEDGVYVGFSGGKDSTVLLDIVRKDYPEVKAVFVDTGLEYPEIRQFVKGFDNVDWVRPKMTFKKVIEKYGYPFISKEVSESVYGARKYLAKIQSQKHDLTDRQTAPYAQFYRKLQGIGEYQKDTVPIRVQQTMRTRKVCSDSRGGGTTTSIENSEDWESIKEHMPLKMAAVLGILTKDNKIQENIPSKDRSRFNCERYKFFLDAPFEISSNCCSVMKKAPVHNYAKQTGRKPITAQMASESRLRTQKWLQYGCNGFDMKSPISNPMSFWTEQDVLLYIREAQDNYDKTLRKCNMKVRSRADKKERKAARKWIRSNKRFEICSVYGEIVTDDEESGQMTLADVSDLELFDIGRPVLHTTGCNRTGCMFCGYGCHLEKSPGRFERMKITHPKQYEFIMKPWSEGGLGYKDIIDWINEHGNLNIKY